MKVTIEIDESLVDLGPLTPEEISVAITLDSRVDTTSENPLYYRAYEARAAIRSLLAHAKITVENQVPHRLLLEKLTLREIGGIMQIMGLTKDWCSNPNWTHEGVMDFVERKTTTPELKKQFRDYVRELAEGR